MGRTTYPASRIGFIANQELIDYDGGHQIDWANVAENRRTTPGVIVVVAAAGALKDATTVPVDALSGAVKKGTVLNFGTNKFATVNADAAAGATSLTTLAIPTALVDNDAAIVPGSGSKFLPAGTVVGTKISSDASSGKQLKLSPRVVTTNPAVGLLASDAVEGDPAAAVSGYGLIRGGPIYENLLPEATGSPPTLAAAVKTELQTVGQGMGFRFEQYADDRVV